MSAPADDTTPLSFLTHFAATERDALSRPGSRPVLLGVFSGPDGYRALVQTADGNTCIVRRGDRLGQAKVLAIGDDRVELGLLGQVHRLTIPGAALSTATGADPRAT